MAQGFLIFICLLLPLGCLIYLHRKYQVAWRMCLYGMLTFFVSQIVLRIPILNNLQEQPQFSMFMLKAMPYILFLSFTAALFEESGRWLVLNSIKKPRILQDAWMFGIGHGMMEAILLVLLPVLAQPLLPLDSALLIGVERFMAMVFHICASLLIYKGVTMKKYYFLIIAYLAHTSFNFFPIYIGSYLISNVYISEGIIMICTLLMVMLTYQLMKRKECRK